jgi:hypothetical protein
VEAYNTAIYRIVAQLRFCGQNVTELEMIEKTLETFHPSNMVLQQQYRNSKYMKYCDLINVLLVAEAQNELLMKNFQMRPAGTAQPEVHANFQNEKNKCPSGRRGCGRRNNQGPNGGWFKKSGDGAHGNGNKRPQKGQNGESGDAKHSGEGCFRCGSQKHWSRTCNTKKHLVDMYQEWKKRQNPEVHFIQAPVDAQTGEHLAELPEPSKKQDDTLMDVDLSSATVDKSDTKMSDEDFDLDEDDLLD